MAVVFISPKERQRVFLFIIVVIVILFVVLFSALIFLAKPPQVSSSLFNKNSAVINADIFTSDQFKSLEVFPTASRQFSYQAIDKNHLPTSGFVLASSASDAENILVGQGYTSLDIQENVTGGRDNPFVPYATSLPAVVNKK